MTEGETRLLPPTPEGIAEAAAILGRRGLVAMPTETVYGLAADAQNPEAVAGIYTAKDRPAFNPLIVHLADMEAAGRIGRLSPAAQALAQAFWPGPLTIVTPIAEGHGLAPAVTAGKDTVALRVPAHPVARALLAAFGGPLAAPSANPSGRVSPTTAAHVLEGLGGRIEAVLDAGPCPVGIESTIVRTEEDGRVRLLRPGTITPGDILQRTGLEVIESAPAMLPSGNAAPEAPGMLRSHYAPRAKVRLNVTDPGENGVHVGFGPDHPGNPPALTLSPRGDLTEAAQRLFTILREADRLAASQGSEITIAPIPRTGIGLAINDRLARAAAPREDAPAFPDPDKGRAG